MADEGKARITDLGDGLEQIQHPIENPNILGDVQYLYTNYGQIVVTDTDLRIAFGDRQPPVGSVKPLLGVVMSREFASNFIQMVAKIAPALEKVKAKLDASAQPPPEIP
jgi:hypothetical protein